MHKDEMVTKKFLIVDRRDRRFYAFEARERREKSPSMTIHHCPEPEKVGLDFTIAVVFIVVVVVVVNSFVCTHAVSVHIFDVSFLLNCH